MSSNQKLKEELLKKFTVNSTYLGKFVQDEISKITFIDPHKTQKPTHIRKHDVLVMYAGSKARPVVVIKVLKDRTVIYIPLTSTDNVHCLSESNSRFFGEGCFSKCFSVCTEQKAIEQFIGVYDNPKLVNNAIRELKNFILKQL